MVNNEERTLEVAKSLEQLKCSYEMYEKTKKETERKLKEALNADGTKRYTQNDINQNLKLINDAQLDVIEQYKKLGGKEEDLKKKSRKKTITEAMNGAEKNIMEMMKSMAADREEELKKSLPVASDRDF